MWAQLIKGLLFWQPAPLNIHRPFSTMQMQPTKIHSLTATEAVTLFKANSLTVEEYARALLGRVKERDDTVKAWAYLGLSRPS